MAQRFLKTAGGSWSAAATWSATGSGGADSVGPPTAADDCILESGSGSLTIDTGAVCRSLDTTSGTGSYSGTITHNTGVTLNIGTTTAGAGSVAFKLNSGLTYTLGGATNSALQFISTSATVQTITTGGKTLGNWTINGASSSYQLTDSNTIGTSATVALVSGTLDTNGQTCSWGLFDGTGAVARTLTLGASSITITGTGITVWNMNGASNLIFNANSSTITLNGTNVTFNGGNQSFNNVSFTGATQAQVGNANTFVNLTRTGTAAKTDTFIIANSTQTVTGTLTINGNSNVNRVFVKSVTLGTQQIISAAALSISNADFQDISGIGSASWNLSGASGGAGDCLGNSNIIFTSAITLYWFKNTGNWGTNTNWFLNSGGIGAGRVPLPQDNVRFDANSFTSNGAIVTANQPRLAANIDWTGSINNPIFSISSTTFTIFGSITFASGVTGSGNSGKIHLLQGRSNTTFTSAGYAWRENLTIQMIGGTITLQDDLVLNAPATNASTITLTNGTLNTNNHNVTCQILSNSNANTRALILGSSILTLTGTGTVLLFTILSNFTLNAGTSTIVISDVGGLNKTLLIGALITLYNLIINPGGTGDVLISGSVIWNNVTVTGPKTVKFLNGNTNTMNFFNVNGTSGNLVTMRSTVNGYPWKLNVLQGYTASFIDLQDSDASGSAIQP